MQPQFQNQPFPNQQFPNMMQPGAPAAREFTWKVAVANITVQYTPEVLSARSGLKSWSVPRGAIEAWAIADRSGDAEHIQNDLSKFLMLGAWGELLVGYRAPSGSLKFERVNLDANNRECQALIQALQADMPDRFRGMGPLRKIHTAVGLSNAGYWIKQVLVLSIVLGLVVAGIVYLAMTNGQNP